MSDLEDEVFVVEEDDLEEGEITDTDSDIEVVMSTIPKNQPPNQPVKPKKLPKQYSLHENKVTKEKHKKVCKHAHHSNHKVKDKNKSPIANGTHKKHKYSCSQNSYQKYSKAPEPPKKYSISPSSVDNHSVTKSAFKNFSSPPRPVLPKVSPSSKLELRKEDDDDNYNELLLAYKKVRQHIKSKKKSRHVNHSDTEHSSKKSSKRSSYDYYSSSKNKRHRISEERTSPLKNDARSPKENCANKSTRLSKANNVDTPRLKKSPSVEIVPVSETTQVHVEEPASPIEEIEEVDEIEVEQVDGEELVVEQEDGEEESEDEEELRRMALAAFAKRTLAKQKDDNVSAINSPTHSLSNHSSVELFNGDSSTDNHNVVDMDLDEENFVENIHDNLFVIDNNPGASSEFNPYFYDDSLANHSNSPANYYANHDSATKENYLPHNQELSFSASFNQMNEDAEEAILRAEVIASMLKKRPPSVPVDYNSTKHENSVNSSPPQGMFNKIPVISGGHLLMPSNENASMYKKRPSPLPVNDMMIGSLSPQDLFNKSSVYSNGQFHRSSKENINTEIAKLGTSKLTNSKRIPAPKPRNINATQNRLIITLNNDTSSDESDEDEISNSRQNAVESSIDALISDARLKSDMKANSANLNHVSCLSKAQQEEYQKLRNLLAEREPITIFPQAIKEKVAAERVIKEKVAVEQAIKERIAAEQALKEKIAAEQAIKEKVAAEQAIKEKVAAEQAIKEKIAAEHQNLNFLTNKINLAKEKLEKEVKLLENSEKEVVYKKKTYLSAKLKFQHLQEQLHAAKLHKAATLKAWKVQEAKLGNAKSVVTKQKALLALLETEYKHRHLQFEQNSSSPLIQ